MEPNSTSSVTRANAPAAKAHAAIRLRRGRDGAVSGAGAARDRLARSIAACSGVTMPRSSIRRIRSSGCTAHLPDQARGFLGPPLSRFDAVQHPVGFDLVVAAQL